MQHLRKQKIQGQKSGVWALPPKPVQAAEPTPSPAVERRAFVRHFCDIGALVDSWPAQIENISRGGLKVIINRRFEMGTILKVEVPMGAQGSYTFLARVIRAASESTGGWGLGCALLQGISEEEIQSLLTKEAGP